MIVKRTFPILIFLLVSFIGSYTLFTFYKPKTLTELSRIKGYSTQKQQIIPYPAGAKELGKDVSSNGKRITLQTEKTPEEVKSFYTNVYTVRGWKLVSKGQLDGSDLVSFTKNGKTLVVSTSTSQDSVGTIVVVEEVGD